MEVYQLAIIMILNDMPDLFRCRYPSLSSLYLADDVCRK